MTCAPLGRFEVRRRRQSGPERRYGSEVGLADAVIDGITTRYELIGSGAPLLMFSPGRMLQFLDSVTR
jgi:hypothetical protein